MKLEYIRNGDYYIPNLTIQKEERSIGKWGRMHREFLREHHPIQFSQLVLSDTLFTYLADLNEQAYQRMETLIPQMQIAEGVTEELKKLSLLSCMECGCCAFECPAKRPLVQAFRLGKQLLREQKK